MPRLYSNKLLTDPDLYHLCGNAALENLVPRVFNKHAEVLKLQHAGVYERGVPSLAFTHTQRYVAPPLNFVASHAWDCSWPSVTKVEISSLTLWELHMHRKLFRNAVSLPDGAKAGDLLYVDTSLITAPTSRRYY